MRKLGVLFAFLFIVSCSNDDDGTEVELNKFPRDVNIEYRLTGEEGTVVSMTYTDKDMNEITEDVVIPFSLKFDVTVNDLDIFKVSTLVQGETDRLEMFVDGKSVKAVTGATATIVHLFGLRDSTN